MYTACHAQGLDGHPSAVGKIPKWPLRFLPPGVHALHNPLKWEWNLCNEILLPCFHYIIWQGEIILDGSDLIQWALWKRSFLQLVAEEGVRYLKLGNNLTHDLQLWRWIGPHGKECWQPYELNVTPGWHFARKQGLQSCNFDEMN